MSNFITPELYASKTSTTNSVLTPQVYLSKTQIEHTALTPQVYLSGIWRYNAELNADTEITVIQPWRYENPGYREKTIRFGYTVETTAEQSSTGVGFYHTASGTAGDFPGVTGTDVWVKCDIWSNSNSNTWRLLWSANSTGLILWSGKLVFDYRGTGQANTSITYSGKHTLLAHIVSAASNGKVEAWWDGTKAIDYTGNTETTIDGLRMISESGANVLASNIIISNEQIGFDENTTLVSNQWIQPVISSAGTWGVSDFACSHIPYIFNSNTDHYINYDPGVSTSIYSKKPLKINRMYLISTSSSNPVIQKANLQYSDDGNTWTACGSVESATTSVAVIKNDDTGYHHYWKFINSDSVQGRVYNVNIDALVGAEEISFDEDFDTSRTIVKSEPFDESFDTKRTLPGSEPFDENFDTSRRLYETFPFDLLFDTVRNAVTYFAAKGDTRRTVTATVNEIFDTSRSIIIPFNSTFDTTRNLAETFSVLFDTQRNVDAGFNENFDTQRNMTFLFDENFDTKRKLPIDLTDMQSAGVQSIEISMSEKQLSDTISVTFAGNTLDIETALKGVFYDYNYSVAIEKTSTAKGICSASCCTDIDKIIYEFISYVTPYKTAQDHAKKVAAAIGKNLIWQASNFISTMDTSIEETTYQSILSNLFGWSDQIPTYLINAFIRGDNIYVIQRGHEGNSVDITNILHTDVTIDREIFRTTYNSESATKSFISSDRGYVELIWHEPVEEEETADEDKNKVFEYGSIEKFSGTLRFGDTVATYDEGNCTSFENSKNLITTS